MRIWGIKEKLQNPSKKFKKSIDINKKIGYTLSCVKQ